MDIKDVVRTISRHKPELLPILERWAKDNVAGLMNDLTQPDDTYPTVVPSRNIYDIAFYLELKHEIQRNRSKKVRQDSLIFDEAGADKLLQ